MSLEGQWRHTRAIADLVSVSADPTATRTQQEKAEKKTNCQGVSAGQLSALTLARPVMA